MTDSKNDDVRGTDPEFNMGTPRKLAPGQRDAFFRNLYRKPNTGDLSPLTCGVVNFKAGEIRFVSAQAQRRSGGAFENAVTSLGWLLMGDTKEELEIDLDIEENPETTDRLPELPGDDDTDEVSTATDEARSDDREKAEVGEDGNPGPTGDGTHDRVEVGQTGMTRDEIKAASDARRAEAKVSVDEPASKAPPTDDEPPASVEMPPPGDPPVSVENAPTGEAEAEAKKSPSATDLLSRSKKKSSSPKRKSSKKRLEQNVNEKG